MRWVIPLLVTFGIFLQILRQKSLSTLVEVTNCTFCYGTSLCPDIISGKIQLEYRSFTAIFNNLFSVKNVFFADYDGRKVILKKLGYEIELEKIRGNFPELLIEDMIIERMLSGKLKVCGSEAAARLLGLLSKRFSLEEIWTILKINGEPLVLEVLKESVYVPQLLGACGLLIIEENSGFPLNDFSNSKWQNRVFLAQQLIQAALAFTASNFRVYLTDVSPDNIAVDDDFQLRFVDLENVVLNEMLGDNETAHYSESFEGEENFAFSEHDLCEYSLSDHNIYAVCKLLLSSKAPWPMMEGGLLHTPPDEFLLIHIQLQDLIQNCVSSKNQQNRFQIAEQILDILQNVSTSN